MSRLKIFDPPLDCSNGLCGVSQDPELFRIAAALERLKLAGIWLERYNMSAHTDDFDRHPAVARALADEGAGALPITLLDGEIVKRGAYPTTEELAKWAALETE